MHDMPLYLERQKRGGTVYHCPKGLESVTGEHKVTEF